MNTSKRVTFVQISKKGSYNPETSQRDTDVLLKTVRPCHVSDLGIEESLKIFGNYKDDRKIVLLRQPYIAKVDYVLLNESQYRVVSKRLGGRAYYIERGQ
ncbi:hypothetical protein [Streptococcus porci]|uniref:hypothetical protein n=1 Tax=Streptococcus porci TaxID=502567 RepID=UPI000414EEBE|nr:hypothetical protein [Streptococcus porci]